MGHFLPQQTFGAVDTPMDKEVLSQQETVHTKFQVMGVYMCVWSFTFLYEWPDMEGIPA